VPVSLRCPHVPGVSRRCRRSAARRVPMFPMCPRCVPQVSLAAQPRRQFRSTPLSRDIDTAAKFIGAGAPPWACGLGAGSAPSSGSLIIGYA
uniref:Uncharacterized protein n=1 Tax=Serinus canaria TaxID=9135 RepID=A0A8C9KX32_SERCA